MEASSKAAHHWISPKEATENPEDQRIDQFDPLHNKLPQILQRGKG